MRTLAWLIALSPVFALSDEELIGVWERTTYWDDMLDVYAEATIRYTFKTDNQFELYQNIVLHEDMPVHGDMAAGDGEVEAQADRDLAVDRDLVGLGSGTWWTVADSLFLDVSDVEETLNRDSLVAILTDIGKRTALQTCAMLDGWCPEDPEVYAAYEEAVVAEVIRNFRHAFYFEGDSGPVNTYRIEHGKLWIIETWEDGTVGLRDFSRMDPATAVTSSAWGALKQRFK